MSLEEKDFVVGMLCISAISLFVISIIYHIGYLNILGWFFVVLELYVVLKRDKENI